MKKFLLLALFVRGGTMLSGTVTDRIWLSSPNLATAPGSVTKSKDGVSPTSVPMRTP